MHVSRRFTRRGSMATPRRSGAAIRSLHPGPCLGQGFLIGDPLAQRSLGRRDLCTLGSILGADAAGIGSRGFSGTALIDFGYLSELSCRFVVGVFVGPGPVAAAA